MALNKSSVQLYFVLCRISYPHYKKKQTETNIMMLIKRGSKQKWVQIYQKESKQKWIQMYYKENKQ